MGTTHGGSTSDSGPQLSVGVQEARHPGVTGRGGQKNSRWMLSFPAQLMELYSKVVIRPCLVLVALKGARPNFPRNPGLQTHDALPPSFFKRPRLRLGLPRSPFSGTCTHSGLTLPIHPPLHCQAQEEFTNDQAHIGISQGFLLSFKGTLLTGRN